MAKLHSCGFTVYFVDAPAVQNAHFRMSYGNGHFFIAYLVLQK